MYHGQKKVSGMSRVSHVTHIVCVHFCKGLFLNLIDVLLLETFRIRSSSSSLDVTDCVGIVSLCQWTATVCRVSGSFDGVSTCSRTKPAQLSPRNHWLTDIYNVPRSTTSRRLPRHYAVLPSSRHYVSLNVPLCTIISVRVWVCPRNLNRTKRVFPRSSLM